MLTVGWWHNILGKMRGTGVIDRELIAEVEKWVKAKTLQQVGFTAYDITTTLRATNIRCKHDDVKQVVHQMFDDGDMNGYTRELRNMGGPVPAWYYFHRDDYAAQQYVNQGTIKVTNVTGTVKGNTVASVPSVFTGSTQQANLYANSDKRSTVCVPSSAIKMLHLRPGETAVVIPNPNNREIIIKAPGMSNRGLASNARFYTVDKNCNVRITSGAQHDANAVSLVFAVSVENNEIILRPTT